MACKPCKEKIKKSNPSNILTGVENNRGLKFMASKKGKILTYVVLLLLTPLIALMLPFLFYWAIFGLPKMKKNNEEDSHTNTAEQSGQVYKLQT